MQAYHTGRPYHLPWLCWCSALWWQSHTALRGGCQCAQQVWGASVKNFGVVFRRWNQSTSKLISTSPNTSCAFRSGDVEPRSLCLPLDQEKLAEKRRIAKQWWISSLKPHSRPNEHSSSSVLCPSFSSLESKFPHASWPAEIDVFLMLTLQATSFQSKPSASLFPSRARAVLYVQSTFSTCILNC